MMQTFTPSDSTDRRLQAWLDDVQMAAYAAFQPPPLSASYSSWASNAGSDSGKGSAASDTASVRSLALPPISTSGPFLGSGPSSSISDEDADSRRGGPVLRPPMRASSSGSAGRCSSLPPPTLPHRPYRRRTQEARDMVAMQSLMPGLYPDGRHDHSHRPVIAHTSSYVQDDGDAPSPTCSSDSGAGTPPLWQTPATDHPLTVAESAEMLERVQHDLLGMDITKLKGPLAEIARKNDPDRTPRASAPPNAFRASPRDRRSESLTVSPKDAFLDYDAVSANQLSPRSGTKDGRLSSPMPSLFAPLAGPPASHAVHSPLRTAMLLKGDGRDSSPPFGMPASSALIRGSSNPSPTSPKNNRSIHLTRYSVEPERAPRNAVRWISAKREPNDDAPGLANEAEGEFDWSPSSEEGEDGLALENPRTPPQVAVPRAPISAKTDGGIPFSLDNHPLSADLAYISPLPTPSYPIAPPLPPTAELPTPKRPAMVQHTSSHERWGAIQTPAESAERSTCEEDGEEDETGAMTRSSASSSEEWTPGYEAPRPPRRQPLSHHAYHPRAGPSELPTPPTHHRQQPSPPESLTPAKRQRAAPVRDDYTDDDGDDSSDEVVPVAKQRKGKDGKRGPPKPRNPSSRSNAPLGEGSIICDYVDPDTGIPCNTPFRRPYDLARHKDTKHTDRANKPTWQCESCGSSFSRRDALMRHARLRNHKMPS